MGNGVILNVASFAITLWGIGHVIPTRSIVHGFGPISQSNRRILVMEWIAEGATLCFIGLLTLVVASVMGHMDRASILVYRICAAMLLFLAGLSLFTGARTDVLPMKLCPLVKTVVATAFLLGGIVSS